MSTTNEPTKKRRRRTLFRISDYLGKYWTGAEAMYGVIIVMTFTSTLRNARLDAQVLYSTIVFSALLCCVAWGLADGFFYAWEDAYTAKTRRVMIEDSKSDDKKSLAESMIKEELDDTIIGSLDESDRKKLYESITKYLSRPGIKAKRESFVRTVPHYLVGTSMLSAGSGLIVLSPFFFFRNDIPIALNISNLLGVLTLFTIGFFRTQDDRLSRKLSSGIISAILGAIIALTTIALGG